MIQSAAFFGCEAHQCPVAKTSGDEGIHVSNGETKIEKLVSGQKVDLDGNEGSHLQVLTSQRYTEIALINAVCKARKRRQKADH